jgi:hypothetical protein
MYIYECIKSVFRDAYAYTICAFMYSLPYLFNISSKIFAEAFKVTEESVYTLIHHTQAQVSADSERQVIEKKGQKQKRERL